MTPSPLAEILDDRRSGAEELERRLCHALLRGLKEGTGGEEILGTWLPPLLDRFALMANLLRWADRVASICEASPSLAGARRRLGAWLRERLEAIEEAPRALGALLAARLEGRSPVLTLSRSGTVLRALVEAGRTMPLQVVVAESRPEEEGRDLAAALAAAGLRVWVVTDAALAALAAGTGPADPPFRRGPSGCVALVGADRVSPAGLVNKVGTSALSLAVRHGGGETWALLGSGKILPERLALAVLPEWADEPGRGDSGSVPFLGFDFETVPLDLIDAFFLPRGVRSAKALRREGRELKLSTAVEGWLRSRSGGGSS